MVVALLVDVPEGAVDAGDGHALVQVDVDAGVAEGAAAAVAGGDVGRALEGEGKIYFFLIHSGLWIWH